MHDLSMDVSGMFSSPAIIVLLLISPFRSINSCFIFLCATVLGAYIFISVMSSWWKVPFIIIYCHSLSLIVFFILKSALSDITMETPTLFYLPLAWSIVSHPFILSLFVFSAEMCFLEAAYCWVLFSNPPHHSVSVDWRIQSIYI